MSAENLARAAVERLTCDQGLRSGLDDEGFGRILERAVAQITQASTRCDCNLALAARIKEILASVRLEVEDEALAQRSPKQPRRRRFQPEARRP